MAPSHVQTQVATTNAATNTVTKSSFAVGSGANRTLVAYVLWRDDTASAAPYVASLVFNSTESFTYRVRGQINYAGDNYLTAEIWTLDNPTNTTANVVATLSQAVDSEDGIALVVSEYTGANNGIGNTGAATGNSSAPAVTFTTAAATGLICAGSCQGDPTSSPYTPGSGTTERADGAVGTAGMSYCAGEEAAGGGSDTIGWTASTSTRWAMVAIELKAAAAGGAGIPVLYHQRQQQGMS